MSSNNEDSQEKRPLDRLTDVPANEADASQKRQRTSRWGVTSSTPSQTQAQQLPTITQTTQTIPAQTQLSSSVPQSSNVAVDLAALRARAQAISAQQRSAAAGNPPTISSTTQSSTTQSSTTTTLPSLSNLEALKAKAKAAVSSVNLEALKAKAAQVIQPTQPTQPTQPIQPIQAALAALVQIPTKPQIQPQIQPQAPLERKKPRREKQPYDREAQIEVPAAHFDPNIRGKDPRFIQPKRSFFHFVKPGTHIKESKEMKLARAEAELQEEIAVEAAADDLLDLRTLGLQNAISVEWWDLPLLIPENTETPASHYPSLEALGSVKTHSINPKSPNGSEMSDQAAETMNIVLPGVQMSAITKLIHVPKRIKAVIPPPSPKPAKVLLTKAERRKKRRQERVLNEEVQQGLIRAGLIQPNPPKLKLSNFMRVLPDIATSNPTLAESMARDQMQARQDEHDKRNHERMLTKEQKAEKLRKKLAENTKEGVHVAVFRAGDMRHGQTRFKVQMNAEQYNLTGVALINPDCNLVIVEGGERNLKKYTTLMLRRIKWAEMKAEAEREYQEQQQQNTSNTQEDQQIVEQTSGSKITMVGLSKHEKCELVWSGTIAERMFSNFRTEMFSNQKYARTFLEKHGSAQFWDLALSYKAPSIVI